MRAVAEPPTAHATHHSAAALASLGGPAPTAGAGARSGRVGRPLSDAVLDCQAMWFEEEMEVGRGMRGHKARGGVVGPGWEARPKDCAAWTAADQDKV